MGLVPNAFYDQLKKDNYTLTDDARALRGKAATYLGNVSRLMQTGDRLPVTRALTVDKLVEFDPRLVFKGDGTEGNPDRFNRDFFVVLPFQLKPDRYAIAYYVMTPDTVKKWKPDGDPLDIATYDMPDQDFEITLGNIRGANAHLSVYDPRANKILPAQATGGGDKTLSVRLPAADYPRFLLVIEDQPGPLILEPGLTTDANGKATLTFKTNLPVEPRVTTGPIPDRVGGTSLALPRGTQHTVELSLEDKHGVRVTIENDGLTCVWPRWGWDVQGVKW